MLRRATPSFWPCNPAARHKRAGKEIAAIVDIERMSSLALSSRCLQSASGRGSLPVPFDLVVRACSTMTHFRNTLPFLCVVFLTPLTAQAGIILTGGNTTFQNGDSYDNVELYGSAHLD